MENLMGEPKDRILETPKTANINEVWDPVYTRDKTQSFS